jgi:CheY-like chemotaxis protein
MENQTPCTFSVYVVDDVEVIASTVARILRTCGIDAVAFNLPADALEAAKLKAPDLLLTDVMMPVMTGIELAILVKEVCPDCKVLLFSGQASTSDLLTKARKDGHNFEILAKPVHPKDLLAKIRSIVPESPAP